MINLCHYYKNTDRFIFLIYANRVVNEIMCNNCLEVVIFINVL